MKIYMQLCTDHEHNFLNICWRKICFLYLVEKIETHFMLGTLFPQVLMALKIFKQTGHWAHL